MTDAPNVDLSALVEPVEAIAREAGRRILGVYAGSFSVIEKADQSPVTAADFAAHDCILHGLAELTPDIPVLSEEAPDVSFAERSRWEWLWLVDRIFQVGRGAQDQAGRQRTLQPHRHFGA